MGKKNSKPSLILVVFLFTLGTIPLWNFASMATTQKLWWDILGSGEVYSRFNLLYPFFQVYWLRGSIWTISLLIISAIALTISYSIALANLFIWLDKRKCSRIWIP